MNREEFGCFIAESRKTRDLTQKDLAAVLHVTDKAVSKWERGLSYPDVTLLEPLAAALDMGVEDLMTCRRPEQEGSAMTEEMKNLVELSADSIQSERKKGWRRVTILAVLLVVLSAALLLGYMSRFTSETRRSTIFLMESVGQTDYIYLKEGGHLLRLACGSGVDFDSLKADDTVYSFECRWNRRTYEGTVSSIQDTGHVSLGGLMDVESEILCEPLFGHEEVYYRDESYYPDPYGIPQGKAYLCDFRFWLWDFETDWQEDLLVVEDCISATLADLDGDGEKEVVARTRWPEKPYTVYDWTGGEFVITWPETIRPEILERMVAVWER